MQKYYSFMDIIKRDKFFKELPIMKLTPFAGFL